MGEEKLRIGGCGNKGTPAPGRGVAWDHLLDGRWRTPEPEVIMENIPFQLDIAGARARISPHIQLTPMVPSLPLSQETGVHTHLKLESLQVTGSFKARGAANRMLEIPVPDRDRGVVACSSGNHGRAVAYMAKRLRISATVCVPAWVDPVKHAAIQELGAEVVLVEGTYDDAEAEALRLEGERGLIPVHPFDDPAVIAGQGTLGLELLEQAPTLDTVVVPLSGGGLCGGVAYALKSAQPGVRVVAVSAENARVMYESVRAGRVLEMEEEETLASALSGGIGLKNRYSFPLIQALVDEHLLVSEGEIADAMLYAARQLHLVVEGGGAVGLAALLQGAVAPQAPGGTVAVVVSGGNVGPGTLAEVAERRSQESTPGNLPGLEP